MLQERNTLSSRVVADPSISVLSVCFRIEFTVQNAHSRYDTD